MFFNKPDEPEQLKEQESPQLEQQEEQKAEIVNPSNDQLAPVDRTPTSENPHGDAICTGCGKPINVPTIHDDKGIFHGPDCYAKV